MGTCRQGQLAPATDVAAPTNELFGQSVRARTTLTGSLRVLTAALRGPPHCYVANSSPPAQIAELVSGPARGNLVPFPLWETEPGSFLPFQAPNSRTASTGFILFRTARITPGGEKEEEGMNLVPRGAASQLPSVAAAGRAGALRVNSDS